MLCFFFLNATCKPQWDSHLALTKDLRDCATSVRLSSAVASPADQAALGNYYSALQKHRYAGADAPTWTCTGFPVRSKDKTEDGRPHTELKAPRYLALHAHAQCSIGECRSNFFLQWPAPFGSFWFLGNCHAHVCSILRQGCRIRVY